MTIDFIHALQSEWLKRKRSLGAWLVIAGAFFTPTVVIVARLVRHSRLPALYNADAFWTLLWRSSWQSMAIFFLPVAAILATSLVTQIEYRNNAWKQVHALPLSSATIFFSKFAVIVLMMAQFVVLFDVGIYLSALIPYLLISGVPYPPGPLPLRLFFGQTALYFVDCLPIAAAQYLLSLRFKNFLVPIGAGFLMWIGALSALSWKSGFVIPYTYSMLDYLKDDPAGKAVIPDVNIHLVALAYFLLFTFGGYCLFLFKGEKG